MPTYMKNNLAVKAEQIHKDFELSNEYSSYKGKAGDYVVHENGTQIVIPKHIFEQEYTRADKKAPKNLREWMEQGYKEMAQINLEIANEMSHLEHEAHKQIEKNFKNT